MYDVPNSNINDVWSNLPMQAHQQTTGTFNDRAYRDTDNSTVSPSNNASQKYLDADGFMNNCHPLRESSNSKERRRQENRSIERQHYAQRYD